MDENRFVTLRENYFLDGIVISQRKLAPMIGIAAPHISEIEKGLRSPSIQELKKYHHFFRVSYEYLLSETDDYVSSDVFKNKPTLETNVQNTLRWLEETKKKDEKELRDTVHMLLGTERGLLLLFYITQIAQKGKNIPLADIIREIAAENFNKCTYAELRMYFDKKGLQ